jgi:hypothetical protein
MIDSITHMADINDAYWEWYVDYYVHTSANRKYYAKRYYTTIGKLSNEEISP